MEGRTPDHCLTSGLDDYPRARPPHTGELHVDLLSWMGYFARTLKEVAEYLGYDDDVLELRKIEGAIVRNLDGIIYLKWANEIYIGVKRNKFIVMQRLMILVCWSGLGADDRGQQVGLS